MSTMPLSEVKARLSEIADEVDRTHEPVHVNRNGREYVVLLSAEDLESLEATIELLRDDAGMSWALTMLASATRAHQCGHVLARRQLAGRDGGIRVTDTATALMLVAGDNPDRLSSPTAFAALLGASPIEASSGKTVRMRLNRGGDRQGNSALWHIVISRMASQTRNQGLR